MSTRPGGLDIGRRLLLDQISMVRVSDNIKCTTNKADIKLYKVKMGRRIISTGGKDRTTMTSGARRRLLLHEPSSPQHGSNATKTTMVSHPSLFMGASRESDPGTPEPMNISDSTLEENVQSVCSDNTLLPAGIDSLLNADIIESGVSPSPAGTLQRRLEFDIDGDEDTPTTPPRSGPAPGMDKILKAPLKVRHEGQTHEILDTPTTRRFLIEENARKTQLALCRRRLFGSPTKPALPIDRKPVFNLVKRVISFNPSEWEVEDTGESMTSHKDAQKDVPSENTPPVTPKNSTKNEKLQQTPVSLIGDYSRMHVLSTIKGNHSDLKSISGDTLCRLLEGKFSDVVNKASVIDCRYPYEYNGGHIQGSMNLYTGEAILNTFMKNVESSSGGNGRHVLVFYCEFSSQRGPAMARYLRQMDRAANVRRYPNLHYPEIYLLHNGYKEFFAEHKDYCLPQLYLPMRHPDYSSQLRHFRSKARVSSLRGAKTMSRTGLTL